MQNYIFSMNSNLVQALCPYLQRLLILDVLLVNIGNSQQNLLCYSFKIISFSSFRLLFQICILAQSQSSNQTLELSSTINPNLHQINTFLIQPKRLQKPTLKGQTPSNVHKGYLCFFWYFLAIYKPHILFESIEQYRQLVRRIMYFKQREFSALYQHYQKQEHERLSKKIQQIKTRKQKPSNCAENILPPITHRPTQVRVYQKKLQIAETDRLNKRLEELKNNRSQYFSKVIGLNMSLDPTKINKSIIADPKTTTNNLTEEEETHSEGHLQIKE